MKSPKQSPIPLQKSQRREIRKIEAERDRAQGRLFRIKARRKQKKDLRGRQTLGRQVLNLTIKHTQAIIDGEI